MGTKIFYLYTLLILLLITASSCKDDNEDSILSPNVSITLSREDSYPVLPQEGGSVAIPFKAKDEWTARVAGDNETWISISPVKGNAGEASLTISVIANETPDERKATIILESGTSIANIVVTQKRKDISREVLLEFYKSTNGDGWENNTNWCSNKPRNCSPKMLSIRLSHWSSWD